MERDFADDYRVFYGIYPYLRNTILSTGLQGAFYHNLSMQVDMVPFQKEKEPDLETRAFEDQHLGFMYTAHTSHTYEAGRSRRLAYDVKLGMITSPGESRILFGS